MTKHLKDLLPPAASDELRAIISECVEKHGLGKEAVSALLERVRLSQALYLELLGPYENQAAYRAITERRTVYRRKVWGGEGPVIKEVLASNPASKPPSIERTAALVRSNRNSLFDFPLPGGLLLSAAGRDAVADAADYYETRGRDMAHKGRWLARIAQAMPKGKTVGEAFDAAALEQMKDAAK